MATVEQVLQEIWSDDTVRENLLGDPVGFLRSQGLEVPEGTEVRVHEDRIDVKNFVLPEGVDGDIPATEDPVLSVVKRAFEDEAFKAKLLADANAAVSELGIDVPPGLQIDVWANSPTISHLILPMNPQDTELSDADLEAVAGGVSKGTTAVVATCSGGAVGSAFMGLGAVFTVAGFVVGLAGSGAAAAVSAAGGAAMAVEAQK